MKILKSILFDVAIALTILLFLNLFFIEEFVVKGNSMAPSIFPGERILVLKFPIGRIKRCDVVVFWYPNDPSKTFIKRIAGLPGENVEIKKGTLFINGRKDSHRCIKVPEDANIKMRIPVGFYFVLGDNKEVSNDSRYGWLVPREFLRGKAIAVYWPLVDMRFIK
ncbi:MAG: signal peptidase I [Candidatus Aminicenantes bacterium]|nr:signal peptidase I [Candidatus Aminicenantes bacterium]